MSVPQAGEQGGQGAAIHVDVHHVREDHRLTNLALRKGWIKEKRWNTEITPDELQKRMAEGQLTLKERTLLAVMNGVASTDARVSGIAAKNVIAMEGQNLAEDLKALPDLHLNIHRMAEDEKKDRLAEIIAGVRKRTEAAQVVPPAASNGHANGDSQPASNGSANGHA